MPLISIRSSAARTRLVPTLSAAILVAFTAVVPAATSPAVERKVEDLLARMTLEEKIGQLNLRSLGPLFPWEQLAEGKIGALINFNDAGDIRRAQELARRSRLGIPPLFGLDVLHGFRTVFPVPLGEAASFNPDLSRRVAAAQAREAAAMGLQWTYAPMVDVTRDPRWGRVVEGAGEDTYLNRLLARARVEGFRAGGLATAVKHFAAYGAVTAGRDYGEISVPSNELRDIYLSPYRAAVEAGSETVMSAFTAINGVPTTADPWLLTGVLRKEWGFDGFVVSDWAGIHELIAHGVARDEAEAARKALLAGVDMDMESRIYETHLADELQAGRVPMDAIDEAVRRVLRVKFRLGLFERPLADPTAAYAAQVRPETRALAREAARDSFVLLQNRGDLLPLREGLRRIALIGPLASDGRDLLGPHAARGLESESVTVLAGMRTRAEKAGITLNYAQGCERYCEDRSGFPAAIETALEADAIIAVFGEPQDNSGEAASRVSLDLWGLQRELIDALAATGKPMVLVLMGGRPVELKGLADTVPSILMTWFPGTEGGAAIADVLFGDANPGGKLPVSWPRSAGQLPLSYNLLPSGRPTKGENRFTLRYLDANIRPLYPFGHGLSYTRFAIGNVTVATPRLGTGDILEVRATVTNTGDCEGQEVVQLYIRQPVASRSRPLRELKAFEKVSLKPGERRFVTLQVPVKELGFHVDDGTYVVEPSSYQVFVGDSSAAPLSGEFTVVDQPRVAAEERRNVTAQ
jgi:beta-glucosidase